MWIYPKYIAYIYVPLIFCRSLLIHKCRHLMRHPAETKAQCSFANGKLLLSVMNLASGK